MARASSPQADDGSPAEPEQTRLLDLTHPVAMDLGAGALILRPDKLPASLEQGSRNHASVMVSQPRPGPPTELEVALIAAGLPGRELATALADQSPVDSTGRAFMILGRRVVIDDPTTDLRSLLRRWAQAHPWGRPTAPAEVEDESITDTGVSSAGRRLAVAAFAYVRHHLRPALRLGQHACVLVSGRALAGAQPGAPARLPSPALQFRSRARRAPVPGIDPRRRFRRHFRIPSKAGLGSAPAAEASISMSSSVRPRRRRRRSRPCCTTTWRTGGSSSSGTGSSRSAGRGGTFRAWRWSASTRERSPGATTRWGRRRPRPWPRSGRGGRRGRAMARATRRREAGNCPRPAPAGLLGS